MDNKLKYQIITENENCIYYKILYQNKNYFAKHYKKIKNIKMIYNEINILKELTGLNVPKILNYNIQKKYIIYNYISGQNLNHLKVAELKYKTLIFIKILDTISLIHKKGIIHCDLKPENIILSGNIIYIIDFGIACHLNQPYIFKGIGSIEFSAPEQFNRENVSVKTDIYSLGIILYKMLTDVLPFTSSTNNKDEIMHNHLNNNYILPSHISSNLPSYYDRIIKKCLNPNPIDRYESVEELKKDLITNIKY